MIQWCNLYRIGTALQCYLARYLYIITNVADIFNHQIQEDEIAVFFISVLRRLLIRKECSSRQLGLARYPATKLINNQ